MSLLRRGLMPFAKRFVAGETVESAIRHAESLNEDGITALIDLLGEHVEERGVAEAAADEYLDLLDRIVEEGVDAHLSIKLTHLGLEIDEGFCRDLVHDVVEAAEERDRFVWIDMESSDHTDETIDLYKELREVHNNVGICIQCYLKRSKEDIDDLLGHGAIIRLVKGAYDESQEIAYKDREAVEDTYRDLLERLFIGADKLAIATHDRGLVRYAEQLAEQHDRGKEAYEFQFLMGVRNDLQRELADDYRVAQYVPYGPEWLSYYWRRVRERRENLVFALRALIGR